ncbi:hypothetical protein KBY33_22850 [Streptomyces sp. RM99]|nr:hypothetical protein [Streptomyces sp. RM99]
MSRSRRRLLEDFAAVLFALAALNDAGLRFYGWAAFELAHLPHSDPAAAGDRALLLIGDRTVARAVDEAWARKVADLLAEPPASPRATPPQSAGASERLG